MVLCLAVFALANTAGAASQFEDRDATYKVSGGALRRIDPREQARVDSLARVAKAAALADSLALAASAGGIGADSLAKAGYTEGYPADTTATGAVMRRDAQNIVTPHSRSIGPDGKPVPEGEAAVAGSVTGGVAGAGQAAEGAKAERVAADTVHVRHNWLFRDSIPISRMTAISLVLPGFSQLYNNQAWKVPILYGTVGTAIWFGLRQNRTYQFYRRVFDDMKYNGATQEELNPWQINMIRYNTYRQLLFGAAIVSYIYFIGDGVVHYPGAMASVKRATTLSTICPGAGQFYNGKFWKLPIAIGGLATFAYVIDWNNRGYQRFKLAYNQRAAGVQDEFGGRFDASFLQNLRNSYRRNRDFAIILTGLFYLLNIIDAHVDAHLKDFDMSDNLAMNMTPFIGEMYAFGHQRLSMGMSLNVRF